MNNLREKRILLIGGTELVKHIVNRAHELGMYVIVTDYIKDAPAKAIADEAYDVSALDIEGLIHLAKEKKVDAVFTGYADITLAPCRQVCDALGLPFYATLEQLDQTMNKRNFKDLCMKHGIRVAQDIDYDVITKHPESIEYPVIIKPVDSYSSRGISVVNNATEVKEAIDMAMEVSTCKDIVIEEYITGDDIYLYLVMQDGVVYLCGMADRLLNNDQYGKAPQPLGYFFPSKYINLYYNQIHHKLQNMVDDIGLKDGTFFLQGFVRNGEIILFEMGLRLAGGAGYLMINHANHVDNIEMHLNYAVTGKFSGYDLAKVNQPRFHKPHFALVVLLKNGIIHKIEGLEEILNHPDVFDIVQFRHLGDVMDAAGTLNQVFARIFMSSENIDSLLETIDFLKDHLKIYDTEGNNMILEFFNTGIIKEIEGEQF